jgi:hypothetical protein
VKSQRRRVELLAAIASTSPSPGDHQLEAPLSPWNSFRMQAEAPDAFDIRKEKPQTLALR